MFQDLRYGVRMLLKHPGFTCVAALTLALGIGANTAIFSLIDAVLLKMLPVNNPERLVLLGRALGGKTVTQFPYRTYKQIRDQNEVLSGLLAYHSLRLSVSVDGQPEPAVAGQLVSGNYYSVLGVNAALGRTIAPDDDRAPGESPVCVISHNYWRRRFAGDPAVVGKTIHLGGAPFTIIGVTPPEFFGLEVGSSLDISVPLMMQQQVMPGIRSYVDGADPNNFFSVMGRLQPGVTMPQAQAGLIVLYRQLCAEYAASNWGFKFAPRPWLVLRDALRLVLIGAALGIPAALAVTRLVAGQLFGIGAADPVAIGLATLVLVAVAAVAGYLPARRATRVDPLVALRFE